MSHNRATIYSNGIADFQRIYLVAGKSPIKISIPVRQEHLGDVLASLTVSGDVKIVSPPNFQPANTDDGNIAIDHNEAMLSLARQLSGSTVTVQVANDTLSGQLMGLHSQQVATAGHPVNEISLVVLSDGEVKRFSMREIQSLKFLDPIIQAEIDKALSRSLREIKPNSTFVELELAAISKKTAASIQYTIPAAAWKITYRILLNDAGEIELHGHAIVDNNTDEDWHDFIVSVVMGQPLTFTTDLAVSKTPRRSHVNIVQESAIGSVEIEQPMEMMVSHLREEPEGEKFGDTSIDFIPLKSSPAMARSMRRSKAREAAATVDAAEVSEAGDFCIFESAEPVSISARRSAVIPVLQTTLADSSAVLFFKEANHAERPFRAIKFKNTTPHSLGRGVCTVYDNTTFAGTCILPATKPDEESLLAHALETGVRIRTEERPRQNRRVGIKVADGVAYDSHHIRAQVDYLINNSREQALPFILDHSWRIGLESEIACHLIRDGAEPVELELKRLKDGVRLEFPLLERDVLKVSIVESQVTRSRVQLTNGHLEDNRYRIQWLYENVVDTDLSLSNDPAVRECIEIHKLLMEKKDQVAHAKEEILRHEKRQERLRKNIETGGGEQQNLRWQSDLARAEDAIVQLDDEHIPKLEEECNDLRTRLDRALRSLIIEWNE